MALLATVIFRPLAFDDPTVADEAFVRIYSRLEHPTAEGGQALDDALTFSLGRLLTPTLESVEIRPRSIVNGTVFPHEAD
jgi:hypothetical protein